MRDIDPSRLRYLEAASRHLGALLGGAIKDAGTKYGFALLLFSFKGPEFTWISNAERESMIKCLEEFLERLKHGNANEFPGGVDARN